MIDVHDRNHQISELEGGGHCLAQAAEPGKSCTSNKKGLFFGETSKSGPSTRIFRPDVREPGRGEPGQLWKLPMLTDWQAEPGHGHCNDHRRTPGSGLRVRVVVFKFTAGGIPGPIMIRACQ